MRIPKMRNQLSRSNHWEQHDKSGSNQVERHHRLDNPYHTNTDPKIPRIHRLLQILYTKLLKNCMTFTGSYKESHPMNMGSQTQMHFRGTKNPNVCHTSTVSTKLQ